MTRAAAAPYGSCSATCRPAVRRQGIQCNGTTKAAHQLPAALVCEATIWRQERHAAHHESDRAAVLSIAFPKPRHFLRPLRRSMMPAHTRPSPNARPGRPVYAAAYAALFLLALRIPAALAADASASTASADQGPMLQEVTVTATRREESASKVPISITAISAADMETRGIKDIQGIARFTPGADHRHLGHEQHLHPRHLLLRRLGHHRHLHRRHAHPDARPRLQPGRGGAQDVRHRSRGGAARSAGHAVRRRLGGRYGALHHGAAQPHQDLHRCAQRIRLHPGRRAELRGRRRGGRPAGRRRARCAR